MTTKRKGMPGRVLGVYEQFERWRAAKRGSERIPGRLWEAAAKLCESHSVHRVSRWLGLNHTTLQHRAGSRRRPARASKPSFVEWSLPAGMVPGVTAAEYIVEVKGRVPRIHVRGASAVEVAAMVSALSGQGSKG